MQKTAPYLDEARRRFGAKGVSELTLLFTQNESLFAGGALCPDQLDPFLDALTRAYFINKEHAKSKFGRKRTAVFMAPVKKEMICDDRL